MSSIINAVMKVRGSSNTADSKNLPMTYRDEENREISAGEAVTSYAFSPNEMNCLTMSTDPIWSLGFHFCPGPVDKPGKPHKHCHVPGDECIREFKSCQYKRFYGFAKWTVSFTYRKNFPVIEGTKKTSDLGWGCMHRTSQMIVCQAFVSYLMGNDWKIKCKVANPKDYLAALGPIRENKLREIISLFSDTELDAPLCLHNIVEHGDHYTKRPSEWFGPATTATVLRDIFDEEQPCGFALYAAEDGIIDEAALERVATAPRKPDKAHWLIDRLDDADGAGPKLDTSDSWRPTIVMIPLRVGMDKINPKYFPSITASFKFPQSLGIIGGKPHSSLYFFAAQGEYLHYLDPHRVQEAVSTTGGFPLDSWMLPTVRWIKMENLDPSFALAYLFTTRKDFVNFKKTAADLFTVVPHLFSIVDDADALVKSEKKPAAAAAAAADGDDDGFEILG